MRRPVNLLVNICPSALVLVLRERTADTQLITRAREALARGPLESAALLGHVLSLPGAPPRVAERIAESLFSRHAEFARTSSGEWALILPQGLAPGERATTAGGVGPENAPVPGLSSLRYAVVDVETTGVSVRTGHRITEIAVVPVEGGKVGEPYRTLVNPERSIPAQVVALTRITAEMVRTAPRFDQVCGLVADALRGRVFVAHNAAFDWRFVQTEVERAEGLRFEGDRVCTVRLARVLLPQLRRRSLDALAHYFDVEITERHRALGDALATARILCRLLQVAEEQGFDTWPALSARLDRRTARARRRRSALPRAVDFDATL